MWLAVMLAWQALWSSLMPGLTGVCPLFPSEHERLGVNVVRNYGKAVDDYDVAQLYAGWYVDYSVQLSPARPAGMGYMQTILPSQHYPIRPDALRPLVDANRGALWTLGNEPDRDLQDGMTPEAYAAFYHDLYAFIKGRDPTARIAVAGVVQPTPIRLRYLDRVLDAYRQRYGVRMPVDVWTVHGFILNEAPDEWGASIPVGLEAFAEEGLRRTVDDHDRMDIFRQQIVDFRRWMADRGYRDRPLILSEYGILLPKAYGFSDAAVANFMVESFGFLQTAADPHTGYAPDGNRLVQAWAWYSLNDYEYVYDPVTETSRGFNGNLVDHDSGQITPVGWRFAASAEPLMDLHSNAAIVAAAIEPAAPIPAAAASVVMVTATLLNGGNLDAADVRLAVYAGDPDAGGTLLERSQPGVTLASHCGQEARLAVVFDATGWAPGLYSLTAAVEMQNPQAERSLEDNRVTLSLWLLRPGETLEQTRLPLVVRGGG